MDYSENTFMSDAFGTIAAIVKIVLVIVLKVKAILSVSVLLTVLICIGVFWIPMGATILFIVCKLTGVLSLSWWWMILAIQLDGLILPLLKNNMM